MPLAPTPSLPGPFLGSLLFSDTSLRLGQWGTLLRPWEEQLAVTNLQEGQGGPGSEQQEQDPPWQTLALSPQACWASGGDLHHGPSGGKLVNGTELLNSFQQRPQEGAHPRNQDQWLQEVRRDLTPLCTGSTKKGWKARRNWHEDEETDGEAETQHGKPLSTSHSLLVRASHQ